MTTVDRSEAWIFPKPRLDDLLALLQKDGFEVIGSALNNRRSFMARSSRRRATHWLDRPDNPLDPTDSRNARTRLILATRLARTPGKYLFPPTLSLWKRGVPEDGFEVRTPARSSARALLGVRACELHGMAVQDRVFLDRNGQITDPYYARARERLFVIAIECEHPAGTCFCASMGTGPEISEQGRIANNLKSRPTAAPANARQSLPLAKEPAVPPAIHFDLALTELDQSFVARAGSDAGQKVIARLGLTNASAPEVEEGQHRVQAAAAKMGRSLEVTDIHDLLHRNQEHPRWNDVATRCLSCTNCTLVCPTCFCSSVEDVTDLTLENAERVRHWDSCFNPEFAHVHGGNFRASIRGRYRQWLTHKFASWFDQFDVSGWLAVGVALPGARSASMLPKSCRHPGGGRKAGGNHERPIARCIRQPSFSRI